METHYTPPFGNYKMEYITSLEEVLEDLLTKFPGGEDKPGKLIIVAHGARGRRRVPGQGDNIQESIGINLPVTGPLDSPLNSRDLFTALVNLRVSMHDTPKMSEMFENLIFNQFDSESSLTLFGCYIGKDQKILDLFQSFLGGRLTVFAPKMEQVFNIVPVADLLQESVLSKAIKGLMDKGLLKESMNPIYSTLGSRGLQSAFA